MTNSQIKLPTPFDLSGKVAIVTGGAGLLGSQHSIALAEIGATVIIADIDYDLACHAVDSITSCYPDYHISPLQLDVTSHTSVLEGLDYINSHYGSLDILINNAAIDPKVDKIRINESSRLENFPLKEWRFQLDVGLTGAFICCQIFGDFMSKNGGGVILNIASDLSVIAPDQRIYQINGLPSQQQPVKPISYSVVKSALLGLTRYCATYWSDCGIRVNALSPGGVYNQQNDNFVARLSSLIPMHRMARADEYRSAVQFLCSEASSYMTGQNLIIDGGRSTW
jgi:NAD(P)-dependent dehydrogenase (short-subunit alcohol dehydrogenase family)